MAKGTSGVRDKGKISVNFGEDLFAKINAEAERDGVSFAKVARRACDAYFAAKEGE